MGSDRRRRGTHKGRRSRPVLPELYLQASAMLEDFEILKFKRKGDDTEEIIEEDSLAKLKGRFGRLK